MKPIEELFREVDEALKKAAYRDPRCEALGEPEQPGPSEEELAKRLHALYWDSTFPCETAIAA